jgi:leucyl/phenylalanyl-tRNA--protein transferase
MNPRPLHPSDKIRPPEEFLSAAFSAMMNGTKVRSPVIEQLTPEIVLQAYRAGIFPMAAHRHGADIKWYDPDPRGVLPIAGLHIPRRLRQTVKKNAYAVTFDKSFAEVMRGCADTRPDTWINDEIIALYTALHRQGHAHSVEAWRDGKLVGGAYGIALGGAFFGESMFSAATDASKVALVHLAARLWRQGFELLDTQFINDHLRQFGVYEISRAEYRRRLKKALEKKVSFHRDQSSGSASAGSSLAGASFASSGLPSGVASEENFCGLAEVTAFLQSTTQTS